ncbi:MAG: hypothetical protein ABIZ04_25290 [Opitutus sp.]
MRSGLFSRHRALLAVVLSVTVLAVAVAAFLPVRFESREENFEIPKGTWARRMAGDKVEILPSDIFLTLGVHDVLHLRNLDDVPQIFGPTLLMPGQSFRLPFHVASENLFACTAHASGQLTVLVEDTPDSPVRRLTWRARKLVRSLSSTFRSHQA